jgi:hypothetical protein
MSSPVKKGHITNQNKGQKMITKKDLLAQFTQEIHTLNVEAWNNAEVKIRKLTIKEQAHINSILFGDITLMDADSLAANISLSALQEAQIQTASYALTDPKMSVDEISAQTGEFLLGIAEIHEFIGEWSTPKK